jgi:hypothetical protein
MATTWPSQPTRRGESGHAQRGHRTRGGRGVAVISVSQVAGSWNGSSGESEWSVGNTPGMEARPEAHRGSGSPTGCFGGGEAVAFR